ncbi:unnamed protein product [Somion occarium]|uniref:Uncharacterized protein n=1 Tax=Somion occarium TaxID=3059160 RepID=A0ABP1CUI9_9APHY
MRSTTAAAAAAVPWAIRRKKPTEDISLPTDNERGDRDAHKPLLNSGVPSGQPATYGTLSGSRVSPERFRRSSSSLGRVPEEELIQEEAVADESAEEVEWELEEQGFYRGSYRAKVLLYTFVPLGCLLVFTILAVLPNLIWPLRNVEPPPYGQYFPFPLPEFLVASALWSLSRSIRLPLYTAFSALLRNKSSLRITVSFNLVYAFTYNVLRMAALPILRIRHDMDYPLPSCRDLAFRRVWWLALGWTFIETAMGIGQDYAQIALYKNVMISEDQVAELESDVLNGTGRELASPSIEILPLSPRDPTERPSLARIASGSSVGLNSKTPSPVTETEALELEVDRDLEQLVNLKEREDLEEVYGLPIIKIPVFVLCLQRIDSILITVGITLVLSASYLRSHISLSSSALSNPPLSSNKPILITFPSVFLLNTFLMILYSPAVLPRLGIHTAAYIAFFVGLGSLFAGLGLWGALA